MLSKSISKNSAILAMFAIATTAMVTMTHIFTKPAIELNKKQQLMSTLSQVLPESEYDNI